MLTHLLMLFLLSSNSMMHAMDNNDERGAVSALSVEMPAQLEREPVPVQMRPSGCKKIKKIASRFGPPTLGLTGLAIMTVVIYSVANPPQQCPGRSSEPYLNESEPENIEGYSFDIYSDDCGKCSYASLTCNEPVSGVNSVNQLMSYVNESMKSTCGNNAHYQIKKNVLRKSDPISKWPGRDAVVSFFDLNNQKSVLNSCKVSSKSINKGQQISPSKPQKHKKNFR